MSRRRLSLPVPPVPPVVVPAKLIHVPDDFDYHVAGGPRARRRKISDAALTETGQDVLATLPVPLRSMIFQYLEAGDLARCARVSRSWFRKIADESVLPALNVVRLWPRASILRAAAHLAVPAHWRSRNGKKSEPEGGALDAIRSLSVLFQDECETTSLRRQLFQDLLDASPEDDTSLDPAVRAYASGFAIRGVCIRVIDSDPITHMAIFRFKVTPDHHDATYRFRVLLSLQDGDDESLFRMDVHLLNAAKKSRTLLLWMDHLSCPTDVDYRPPHWVSTSGLGHHKRFAQLAGISLPDFCELMVPLICTYDVGFVHALREEIRRAKRAGDDSPAYPTPDAESDTDSNPDV